MESSCVRQNQIPGTSKLFSDFLYHFDRVSRFYSGPFSDPSALTDFVSQIDYPRSRRAKLVAALREQNAGSKALETLAQQETVAVVTGQQVGLFSGPAYTIFKALTAVRLAGHLTQEGIPAVPVFWLATEDHDLAEIDHAWVFNQNAAPSRISVTNSVVNGGPVGDVTLNELPWAELADGLGDLPFAADVIGRLELAYRPGTTLGSAFRCFLQDVLRGCGLLYLDPLAPAIREIAAPFLADAAARVPELSGALRQRNADLIASGYHAQVQVEEDSSLLFLLSEGRRIPIRANEGRFTSRERSYSAADLQPLAERLSPNALLRPVMQDFLLPTVAYIGGPSEVAYMAQAQVLYERLLGRMPVIFPRNSFTLLDARASKLLDRYGLCLPDVLDHQEAVKSRIASRLVPESLTDQFRSLISSTEHALGDLRTQLSRFDPTLESASKKSAEKILYQMQRLAQKTAREALRRDERASRESSYLIDLIYPERRLQERFYSIVPFLAKHGLDLPERLLGLTQLACPDHMVRTI
ncbi:MAG TPA: bacillithiol biosynthesis cysteine-adding enzyme BshC [Bryobacteraceae bacterium]|jgi:bacillithiol biosynthesis cysteine-adding enzyme BshC